MISKNITALMIISLSCSTLHASDATSERTAPKSDAESKTGLSASTAEHKKTDTQQVAEKPYVFHAQDFRNGKLDGYMTCGKTAAGEPSLPVKMVWHGYSKGTHYGNNFKDEPVLDGFTIDATGKVSRMRKDTEAAASLKELQASASVTVIENAAWEPVSPQYRAFWRTQLDAQICGGKMNIDELKASLKLLSGNK